VAGLASLFGSAANIAREFVARAARLGLFANVAIASNIEAALLAARGFAGITLIPPGEEARQLGDLPVETLPAATETLEILDRWGVRTCAALAALPLLDLSERLGQEGVRLHELARGANNRSLVLAQTSLTFEEEMALDDSVEELEPLSFILGRLLDQLCARMNARALAIQSIRVRFELEPAFENGIERLKDESSRPGAQKPAAKFYEKSLSLPVPMRDSKTLLKLLRLRLQSAPPGAPILKVTISAEPAAPRSAQGGLFVPASPDPEKLELTVARLAHLVGDANVGSPELVDTHRAGEFRISSFRPANPAAETRGPLQSASRKKIKKATTAIQSAAESDAASPSTETKRRPLIAFRAFRPAPPAKVDLHNARPARVAFNGQLASVIAVSGPWRTSGDWWCEDTWRHDEWDLELRFEPIRETAQKSGRRTRISAANLAPQFPPNGVYCLYFDATRQTWFVCGIYD
jgi:protein ImuB